MRVAFDGIIFGLQRVGGISTYSWEILQRLANATPALELVLPRSVISARESDLAALPAHIRRQRLATNVARYLPFRSSAKTDIIHSSYYRIPLGGRARRVVTAYDFVYERYRHGLPRTVHSIQKGIALKQADLVICISDSTRQDLLSYYPDVDASKIATVHLAADPSVFYPQTAPGSDLNDCILFVGQRGGYKRFDLAVEAIAPTRYQLAVVGGGALTENERSALDHWLPGRWVQFGGVENAELRKIYSNALAFIYPSDYEGFGLPILEAQLCGCPAIVADRSSFREVGGEAALFANKQAPNHYSELIEAIGDNAFRDSVIAAGFTNAGKFSWDRTFEATFDCYRRLVAG
jgi:mannosyltransferase